MQFSDLSAHQEQNQVQTIIMLNTYMDNTAMICDNTTTVNLSTYGNAEVLLYSTTHKIIVMAVMPGITVVGILANLAFLVAITRLRRMRKSLNAFLGNLALSDIFFLVDACLIYLVTYTSSPIIFDMPITSSLGCVGLNVPFYFGHLASLGFVTLISVERYYAICQPIRHKVMRRKKRTITLILASWITAFVMSLFFIPSYSNVKEWCVIWPDMKFYENMPKKYTMCVPSVEMEVFLKPQYAELFLIIVFFFGLTLNIALHVAIILTLIKRPVSGTGQNRADSRQREQTRKVSITLAVNTLIYVLCQAPYRLHALDVVLFQLFGTNLFPFQNDGHKFWIVAEVCMFLNSSINPFLYVTGSAFYRRALIDAFKRKRDRSSSGSQRSLQVSQQRHSSTSTISSQRSSRVSQQRDSTTTISSQRSRASQQRDLILSNERLPRALQQRNSSTTTISSQRSSQQRDSTTTISTDQPSRASQQRECTIIINSHRPSRQSQPVQL